MTRSTSTNGKTQRTYEYSERARSIMDQMSVILPELTKTDLANMSIFWMGASLRIIQDAQQCDVREAAKIMATQLSETGYDNISTNLTLGMKVTNLDRFFGKAIQKSELRRHDLLKAHKKLDREVEKAYRSEAFADDEGRIRFLFEMYEGMVKG